MKRILKWMTVSIVLSLGLSQIALSQTYQERVIREAEKGNQQAQVALAMRYALGSHGFEQNDLLAEQWYERAYGKNTEGFIQQTIAKFYEEKGFRPDDSDYKIEVDYERAIYWYEKAWKNGYNCSGQVKLATSL